MSESTKSLESLDLDDVRRILSDEIIRLRAGDSSAAAVNAVSNATGKILSSVKLEMEYFRLQGKVPEIPMLSGPRKGKDADSSKG